MYCFLKALKSSLAFLSVISISICLSTYSICEKGRNFLVSYKHCDVRKLFFVMIHSAQCINLVTPVLRSISVYKIALPLQPSRISFRTHPSPFLSVSVLFLLYESIFLSLPLYHILRPCLVTSIPPPHPACLHSYLPLLISFFLAFYYTFSVFPSFLHFLYPSYLPSCLLAWLSSSLPSFL